MSSRILRLFGAVLTSTFYCAHAQVITTLAGTDFSFPPTPLAAIDAPVGLLAGVAVDANGNVYVSDSNVGSNLVFKVDPQGSLTVVAGNGTVGFSGDGGPATSAALDSPAGLAVDAAGNLYIADGFNQRIRMVTPAGIISTVAGNGTKGYSGDGGPATSAALSLNGLGAVAVDTSGNLFIEDAGNDRIRKVTAGGIISTVAGNGTLGFSGDGGAATSAELDLILTYYDGIAVDASGDLFIADYFNHRVRKVTPAGIISTVAGNGTAGFSGDGGLATAAELSDPNGVTVDAAGNLFIEDTNNSRIRKVTPAGIISTVAGDGTLGSSGNGGPATSATFSLPVSVAVDASDNLYIADNVNHLVRKVNSAGIISTFVGNGMFRFEGDGGTATTANLYFPSGVALDTSGNLFIADDFNNRIRKVTPAGIISTVAGNGLSQFSGDGGPAVEASLIFPTAVAVDASGNLFIADSTNDRIRKVTADGIISTVAGTGQVGYSGDGGPAVNAVLNLPTGVAVDTSGNIYIADNNNNRIRMVTPGGIISTVAGNGNYVFAGDGGPATSATLNFPSGVAVDASGDVFIADSGNNRIRKVTPGGIIGTVAGNGTAGFSGDGGPATSAMLNLIRGNSALSSVALDAAGNLFIADFNNNRIRKVTPAGIISTVAGDNGQGYFGDGGLATNASLDLPTSMAMDANGNLFIADYFDNRIREVLATAPSVSVAPQQLTFTAASGGAPSAAQTLSVTSPVDGLAFSASAAGNPSWLQMTPLTGTAPRLIQVTADPTGLAPMTYQTTITIATPNANTASTSIAVSFTVTAALPAALSIDKPSLSFPFPQNASARSQTINVSNTGSGALPFTAAATTSSGGNWLSVAPASGQAVPGTPAPVTVTANPAGLSAGAYSGQVTITAGAQTQVLPVTMTISALNQAILLSQSGLSFLAVQGGGVVPTQSFGVQNIGTGVVNWTASTSTLAGGSSWLQVTPASGSSDAAASTSPRVTVSLNGSALPAGAYYGLVRVDAPGAANSPQVVTVFLQVLPANTNVAGVVQPAELVFTATAGAESPGSQTVQVYNIVSGAKSFQTQLSADIGLSLVALPRAATLNPQVPTSIVVQPFTGNLSAGVYNGTLALQFSDGSVGAVKLTVIVSRSAVPSLSSSKSDTRPSATTCTPTKLLPALTTLGQTFTVSAGWPTALVVNVADDCGTPLQAAGSSVTISFSNGDQALSLQSQGGGSWEGTWPTGNASQAGVTLNIHAANPQGITGDEQVSGSLGSEEQPPAFTQAGITSAGVAVSYTALAPGSAISIFGNRLAESTAQAQALPLPGQLVDTQLFIAGATTTSGSTQLLNLPLYYVSQNQVNALIPYEVNVNTTLQLLMQRGTTYSMPVQIDMAQAQPAIFSSGGTPGSLGLIYVYPVAGGSPYLMSASAPAHAGDTIVLYCAGLGAVNPPVTDGAAPLQLSYTAGTAQLTIGGQSAQVNFSGLTPGFAGLYQVNAVVPSGTQTGASVPVTLAISGQTSPPITIAIQ